jgi:O-antigen/teichoic acid export membrane protein
MLYALDRPEGPLRARVAGLACYFAIVAPLAWKYDLMGVAGAYVIAFAVIALALGFQVWREYRKVRAARRAVAAD